MDCWTTIFTVCRSGKYYISDFFYIKVPGADTAAIAAISVAALTNGGRLCGRAFSSVTALLTTTTAGTVCGKSVMCGSSNPMF